MPPPAFRFNELPTDAFAIVTDLLSGCELLLLSHTNKLLMNELLAPHSSVWARRLAIEETTDTHNIKRWYYTRRALRFPGLKFPVAMYSWLGAVKLPHSLPKICHTPPFSFSVWFTMEPMAMGPLDKPFGGVILAARGTQPFRHALFIHVDPLGNLYCSVTETKKAIASNLRVGRPYHLALTVDQDAVSKQTTQRVYLNGECVHFSTEPLHREWRHLEIWQLGIGLIESNAAGSPSHDFNGWYGFRGLIENFCVWDRVLPLTEINALSGGGQASPTGVVWSQWATRDLGDLGTISLFLYKCSCDVDGLTPSSRRRSRHGRGRASHKGSRWFRRLWNPDV